MKEKKYGYHPTQKPEQLLEIIIKATSNIHDVILDPFTGGGTTKVVAKRLGRSFIGIEKEQIYYLLSLKRINRKINS